MQSTIRHARVVAIFLFGVIIPTLILGQAFLGLSTLQGTVVKQLQDAPVGLVLDAKRLDHPNGNDYALFAMTYAEASNRQITINKQVLKTCVMEVGLAVISLGLMIILLGFETGGATVAGAAGGYSVNIQTASTGVVVFLAGALMGGAGGLIPNAYSTVGTPMFAQTGQNTDQQEIYYYNECKNSAGQEYPQCFTEQFEALYGLKK
jgi:hypothetical protein